MPTFRSNLPETPRVPGRRVVALGLALLALQARAMNSDDVCQMLREKKIPLDSNTVQRAAAAAILTAVDPRSMLLSPEEASTLDSGQAVEQAETWAEGIGYLKMGGMYDGAASNISSSLSEWATQNLQGLIIDVRAAAGTSLKTVDEICGLFVPADTPLYDVTNGDGEDVEQHRALPAGIPGQRPPLMLIVDGTTRDASEILCLALKEQPGVMLIGCPTLGDDGIREVVPLVSNLVAYVATRWVKPLGTNDFKGAGILPDIPVGDMPQTGTTTVRPENGNAMKPLSEKARIDRELMLRVAGDPALMRAVDILLGLKALQPSAAPAGSAAAGESTPDG